MHGVRIETCITKYAEEFQHPDGRTIPAKWRIAVSARPSLWHPTSEAKCHEYYVLSKYGEAIVRYITGNRADAFESLDLLKKVIEERATDRDETDFPLLSWWQK